jgi:hypothetical protein
MPVGLRRYGLNVNPYGVQRRRLIVKAADRLRFERIHNLKAAEIKKHFRRACEEDWAAFLLVTGPDGSGRRVLADRWIAVYLRWFAYRRRLEKKPKPSSFVYVDYDPGTNADAEQVMTNLLESLRQETDNLGGAFQTGPSEILAKGLSVPPKVDFKIHFAGVVARYSAAMERAGASFGCLVENAETLKILQAALQIFKKASGVIAFRLGSYRNESLIQPFLTMAGEQALEVPLQVLCPTSVSLLAEGRWTRWKGKPPMPFDRQGLEQTFDVNRRSVGRTLKLLEKMLDNKLANHKSGPEWPHDELALSSELIQNLFDYLEKP